MTEPHYPSPTDPWIMGVLNITPDSFSDGGRFIFEEDAYLHGLEMAKDGAHIIDVGGESSRPGAERVSEDEEWDRIGHVVYRLAKKNIRVSVDTTKPEVARRALENGAWMINDISGLRDPDMLDLVGLARCHVCIMHMQGTPESMQVAPEYDDVVSEVCSFLSERAKVAEEYGVPRERICVDPGIGFGKTVSHNLLLLRGLPKMTEMGYPVMIGISRKSLVGKLVGSEEEPAPIERRFEGTIVLDSFAQVHGASILRVHDVRAAVRAARVTSELLRH